MANSILETRNVNDVCMNVRMFYVSWHKVLIWSLKNQWLLNFSCVLLIIKLAESLEILLSWPWEIPLSMDLTCFGGKFVTTSWNKINHFPILTLFFPMLPFDPPENIRKPSVFWCFQGDQKGTLGRKGLKHLYLNTLVSIQFYQLVKGFRY